MRWEWQENDHHKDCRTIVILTMKQWQEVWKYYHKNDNTYDNIEQVHSTQTHTRTHIPHA